MSKSREQRVNQLCLAGDCSSLMAHSSSLIAKYSHSGKIDEKSAADHRLTQSGMLYKRWVFLRSHGEVSRPRSLLMRLSALLRGVIGLASGNASDGPLRVSYVGGGPMFTARAVILVSLLSFLALSATLAAQ